MPKLIAFFKGTKTEFYKLQNLAPLMMGQAAQMRETYRRKVEVQCECGLVPTPYCHARA